jgi:hypothetical protein
MWWHTDFLKTPDSDAAQLYHFDLDRPKWLKVFVYVTDVSESQGPHCFIEGSHKSGSLPRSFLRSAYSRLTDEAVFAHFGKSRERKFVATRGTVIIEDTRGLHKGEHVKNGDRLIFQMQYSNSLFGMNYPKIAANLVNSDLKNDLRQISLSCAYF